ncbi:calmodulin-binding transcription activator 2-like isoform X2 [Narcine bancroftii]|uniref:calmodulin-binding transcription activator 2-like isoform X2 n=1 Tax=Narcine bancroftii TaxID=1343680 RepID=UPI003831E2A4
MAAPWTYPAVAVPGSEAPVMASPFRLLTWDTGAQCNIRPSIGLEGGLIENNNHIKVFLPNKLIDSLPKCASLPNERQRWNTNEEIASYLTSFERHEEWLSGSPRTRPLNGSIILYNRKKVKYRKDGYCWKKRKDGKTTREDHMKLKVQGMECLYGCYVHSSIVPTFHRRCYWLLQNPDIVLVHYLNVPNVEDCGKMCSPILSAGSSDRREWLKWSREELICQLKPMFHCIKWNCDNCNTVAEFSIEQLVHQVMESHHAKPQPRTHACLCNAGLGSAGTVPHRCNSTKHRIISPKIDVRLTPCSALTEVQNLSVGDGKVEGESKAGLQDKRAAKLLNAGPCTNGSSEPPSAGFPSHPDASRRSPAGRANGCSNHRQPGPVASVPGLGTAACCLPRGAVILMAGTREKLEPLAGPGLTPSLQLTTSGQAGALDKGVTPPTQASTVAVALLPGSAGDLALPKAAETHMDTEIFDPDSFLNSPKQGQTYGGGRGQIPRPFRLPELKRESEVSRSNNRVSNSSSASSFSQMLPRATKVRMGSPALHSATTLENMDYASSTDYSTALPQHTAPGGSLPSAHHFTAETGKDGTGMSEAAPSGPEDLQTREACGSSSVKEELVPTTGIGAGALSQTSRPAHELRDLGAAAGPEAEALSPVSGPTDHCPVARPEPGALGSIAGPGDHCPEPEALRSVAGPMDLCPVARPEPKALHPASGPGHLHPAVVPEPGPIRPVDPEGETPMDTSQLNGDANKASLQSSAVKLEAGDGVDAELQCGNVSELYSIIQSDLSSAPVPPDHIDLAIDHFDIFDGQFPDLMPDFMADGGREGARGHGQYSLGRAAEVLGQYPKVSCPLATYSPPPPQQASLQPMDSTGSLPFPDDLATPAASSNGAENSQTACITDFSPEWSYPEITVPASLIQSGVLRCYCPAHMAGLVRLWVTRQEPWLVSASVLFEYRARGSLALPSSQLDWLSLDDNQFRMSILERLEQMEKRIAEMAASSQQQGTRAGNKMQIQASSDSFEERIVALCHAMMSRSCWIRSEQLLHSASFRGMSLLHLAAAQGYSRLIHTLIKWRTLSADSLDVEQEVDPLNVDHFSCTPLMWACALGHVEAAITLYGWNREALFIPDSLGRLPLHVARSRGHVGLAAQLEQLQGQGHEPGACPVLVGQDGPAGSPALPGQDGEDRSPTSLRQNIGLNMETTLSSPSPPPMVPCPGEAGPRHCPLADPDVAMEMGESPWRRGSWVCGQTGNPLHGLSGAEGVDGLWGSPQGEEETRPALHFPDHQAAAATGDDRRFSTATGRHPMETDLLHFNENAENEEFLPSVEVLQVDMVTLAEQIIDATPDRIKHEVFDTGGPGVKEQQDHTAISNTMAWLAGYLENVDQLPNYCQHRAACSQPLTPPSNACISPVSSPLSDITFERVDGPANTDWSDFLNASANGRMESEFALLTLSDYEQRELYEAARIIQTAFRKYKGRRLKEQQEVAALVIQRCYRKYKQYALYKKMTQAAILIQSKFRSYYEQKRFQQSRRAAVLIQQCYRSYKEYEKLKQAHRGGGPLQQMKASFLTKRQDQAARKIMRFLRRCRHRMKELRQAQELEGVPIHGLTT